MIEQVCQGRMLAGLAQTTGFLRRSAAVLVIVALPAWHARVVRAQTPARPPQRDGAAGRDRDKAGDTHRQEGEAILALADAAMAGRAVPTDFAVQWQNDFVKAQRGTFVPFTLTVDTSQLSRPSALVYVRAARRGTGGPVPGAAVPKDAKAGREAGRNRRTTTESEAEASYPVDAIFPVEWDRPEGRTARVSRGFSVLPGEYDVFVVMRERVDPDAPRVQPKASVMRQPLSVPDFWTNELTTSSIIVADRLTVLPEALPPSGIAERPYAIGRNEITPAADRVFRKDEELIVVFLVYNPMVTAERHFDVKVEYHFFRTGGGGVGAGTATPTHPPERPGETYFNHTDPQRFNPALMGAGFDPGRGEPVMAGQVVPLAGFQAGEYRLTVQIEDLLSGKAISRDVFFTVGS